MQNFKKKTDERFLRFFGDGRTKKQTGLKSWDPSTKAGVQLNEWDLQSNVFLIFSYKKVVLAFSYSQSNK